MTKKALRSYFSGRVQGVGFRYKTQEVAAKFALTGYVRNLSDGRVELYAEGDQNELEAFVTALQEKLRIYIETMEQVEVSCEHYQDFSIRT